MDARLVSTDPHSAIPEVRLTERGISIGRSRRQNDLWLDNPSVSRIHATIRVVDGRFVIEDKGSLHGTVVNEQKVSSHALSQNDRIQVGVYRFQYLEAGPV